MRPARRRGVLRRGSSARRRHVAGRPAVGEPLRRYVLLTELRQHRRRQPERLESVRDGKGRALRRLLHPDLRLRRVDRRAALGRALRWAGDALQLRSAIAVSPDGSKVFVTGRTYWRSEDYTTIAYNAS